MRDVDERVAAVQGRVRRIKRQRDRTTAGALGTGAVLVLACVVGMPLAGGQFDAASGGSTLFGASSLFGPSAGGYVLVALVTAVVVALITTLCVSRRRPDTHEESGDEEDVGLDDAALMGVVGGFDPGSLAPTPRESDSCEMTQGISAD